MRSTQFMRANRDSVLSLANYASDCAAETTRTAYIMVKIIFAGMPTLRSLCDTPDLHF